MQPTDQALICQIQAHDSDAFELFFARYRTAIERHVAKTIRDATATDDLVQEVFLRVWTRAEQWDGRGAVKSWLYTIATNLALNHLRAARRRPQQPIDTPPKVKFKEDWNDDDEFSVPAWMIDATAVRPDVAVVNAERQQNFWKLVDTLPDDKRDVFRMVYDADMDLRSVADTLGIPEGTVKSRLYYSKRQLAERWGQDE